MTNLVLIAAATLSVACGSGCGGEPPAPSSPEAAPPVAAAPLPCLDQPTLKTRWVNVVSDVSPPVGLVGEQAQTCERIGLVDLTTGKVRKRLALRPEQDIGYGWTAGRFFSMLGEDGALWIDVTSGEPVFSEKIARQMYPFDEPRRDTDRRGGYARSSWSS